VPLSGPQRELPAPIGGLPSAKSRAANAPARKDFHNAVGFDQMLGVARRATCSGLCAGRRPKASSNKREPACRSPRGRRPRCPGRPHERWRRHRRDPRPIPSREKPRLGERRVAHGVDIPDEPGARSRFAPHRHAGSAEDDLAVAVEVAHGERVAEIRNGGVAHVLRGTAVEDVQTIVRSLTTRSGTSSSRTRPVASFRANPEGPPRHRT